MCPNEIPDDRRDHKPLRDLEVARMDAAGMTREAIARELSVSQMTVYRALRRRRRGNVPRNDADRAKTCSPECAQRYRELHSGARQAPVGERSAAAS